ncbi:hypothetical protein C8J56DRAFT_1159715 [Mycena floridula]|nr:hypothetical protein C8J56DRAFT_1159715 [Mycena floridula]
MYALLKHITIGSVGGDIFSKNILIGCRITHPREDEYPSAPPGSAREGSVEDHDFSFLDSDTQSSELVVGEGYRIYIAEYQGKVTAVKVYEGPGAKGQIEADIALNCCIRHPAIVKYIHSHPTASPPFAMRDVAYGLDHISKFFPLAGIALDLFVKKDKIYISLGVDNLVQAQDGPVSPLVVYQRLCDEVTFQDANRECHFDKHKIVNDSEYWQTIFGSEYDLSSELSSDSDSNSNSDSDSDSESPVSYIEVVEDESEPALPRREYAFVPVDNLSLRDIAADYSRFIHQLEVPMSGVQYLHHLQHNAGRATFVRHRCLGYIRQEVTLSTSVSDSAIISHRTPSLQEICQLCGQSVEASDLMLTHMMLCRR